MTSQRTSINNNATLVYPPLSSAVIGDTVSVVDYGADLTGATSSSTSIANAIAAAGVGGTVVFPAGVYRITSMIEPKEGQTLLGAGIDLSIVKLNWSSFAAIDSMFMGYSDGAKYNPDVTISGFTINGSRDEANYDGTSTQVADGDYDPVTCPDGKAGAISLKIRWHIDHVRITNVNGPKMAVFGAHGSTIRDCLWDQAGNPELDTRTPTSGERDQIAGGEGVTDLVIERCTIMPDCIGSGIDITQGQRVTIKDCNVYASSMIFEGIMDGNIEGNYVGPLGGEGGTGGGGNINVKPNTRYASSESAGAYQPQGCRIIGNTVIGSTGAPGISVVYTDETTVHAGWGFDVANFPTYISGGDNLIENNYLGGNKGCGIVISLETGNVRAKTNSDIIRNNTIVNSTGTTYTLNGTFAACGIGMGGGDKDRVYGNTIEQTDSNDIYGIYILSAKSTNTFIGENTYIGLGNANVGTG